MTLWGFLGPYQLMALTLLGALCFGIILLRYGTEEERRCIPFVLIGTLSVLTIWMQFF